MNKAYDPDLIKIGNELATEMKIENEIHTGVYTCLGGPNYETVAELRMWKMLGVDAVGMSTVTIQRFLIESFKINFIFQVHEVLTARHFDMKVFAFSLITNICITEYETDDEGKKKQKRNVFGVINIDCCRFSQSSRSHGCWKRKNKNAYRICDQIYRKSQRKVSYRLNQT
jgi:purine-nucleoside phosphorylase